MFTALDRNHLFREPNFLPVLFLPDIFSSSSSSALIRLVGMRFGALGKVDEGALPRKGEINDGSFLPLSLFSLSLFSLSLFSPSPPPLSRLLCATHLNIRCGGEIGTLVLTTIDLDLSMR